MSDAKLRLVKVLLIPTFVKDDGENLQEVSPENPIVVHSADWPGQAIEVVEKLIASVDDEQNVEE